MNKILKIPERLGIFPNEWVKRTRIYMGVNYSTNQEVDNFGTVYKFPYIRPFSMINRMKFYQTALTGALLPLYGLLYTVNIVGEETLQLTGTFGVTGCLTLYSLGYLTNNLVGFIYLNKEKELVKISYIDFWGNRKDIVSSISDIQMKSKPKSVQSILGSLYVQKSTDELYRINLRFGEVLDEDLYGILFKD